MDKKNLLSKAWKGQGNREKFSTNESEKHLDPTESIKNFRAHDFLLRQEEAKQWIEEVLGVDINTDGEMDFLDHLKSGNLIARLVNYFLPEKDKIKKIHNGQPGSQMEFMMASDNISNFFQGCQKLELPKIYLFVFSDLWHRKNPLAVVHTIHSLAHFLDRKGKTNIKIKDLTNHGIQFDPKKLERVQKELENLEKQGVNMDFVFDTQAPKQKPITKTPDFFDDFDQGLEEKDFSFAIVDPEKCTYEGKGYKTAIAGNLTRFTIVARDSSGKELEVGGENFKVVLKSKTGQVFPVTVKDLNNGKYDCSYTLLKTGFYDAEVYLGDKKLKGFTVECKDAQVTSSYDILTKLEAEYNEGESYKIRIQAKDKYGNFRVSGGDQFIPQIRYSKDGQSDPLIVPTTSIEDLGDGKYDINFKLPIRGVYQLRLLNPDEQTVFEGFKPQILKAKPNDPPKLDISFENMKNGSTVIQLKASEVIFKNKKDRFISLFLKTPNDQLTEDQKKFIENSIKEKWKGWMRDYYQKLMNNMNTDDNSWDDYEKREKELLEELSKLKFKSQDQGIQFVTITDEKMDWSHYEEQKKKQDEKIKLSQSLLNLKLNQPTFNPNQKTCRPRRYGIDFWTMIRAMIVETKKKSPYKLDDKGEIREYIDKDMVVKEITVPEALNVVRKRDIINYGKTLINSAQRFIFEVLHELETLIPEIDGVKNDLYGIAKTAFAKLKGINDVFMKHMSLGEAPHEEINQKMIDFSQELIKSMTRECLVIIKSINNDYQKILFFNLKLTKEQCNDISLFSNFFKFDLQDLYKGWKTILSYELSSREKKILVNELIFYNQYQKLSNSFEIQVPINEYFDSHLYKGKKNIKVSHDRSRNGISCPYKFAYIKFNHVLFEAIHTASLPGIDCQDSFSRQKICKENAQELLTILAANHAKRFSRTELLSLGNEPLNVPITSVSLLTPFFFGVREDRQIFEQQKALIDLLEEKSINMIQVDLHDAKEPITLKVQFENPVFVNFGTNVVIKTLQMGSSFQRVLNLRKYGMRRFCKKTISFMNALSARKYTLRQEIISFFQQPQFNNREGQLYRENYGKLVRTMDNTYKLMNEIKEENQKKISVLDAQMEQIQELLEKKIDNDWLPYFDDMTSVEFKYLTNIYGTVGKLNSIEEKIYKLEVKHKSKHQDLIEVEFSFVQQLQQLFTKIKAPISWDEYYELALLEKDIFELYSDMTELYNDKEHEKFSQHVIESKEVKEIDPYSIPVRILLIGFHMGEQLHYNCKSGKDRTGMMTEHCEEYVELHAQYGEYPRVRLEKEKYNNHKKQIQNILSMNGSTLDITQLMAGIPGSKTDQAMSGRFYPGYYHKYRGLEYFPKLKYSTKDDWYKYLQ